MTTTVFDTLLVFVFVALPFAALGTGFISARILRHLRTIERLVSLRLVQGGLTMSALDDLTKEVQRNTDVQASAVKLIQGLATQIQDAATNPAKVTALASQLRTSSDALAAAIVANTPAAPTAPTGGPTPQESA